MVPRERDDTSIFNKDDLVEIMKEVQNAMGDKEQFIETFNKFRQQLQTVEEEFLQYQQQKEESSKLFPFWNDYIKMVQLLLQFIHADRTGN